MTTDPWDRRLRTGWRAWLYRGQHRACGRIGHIATGAAPYASVRLR